MMSKLYKNKKDGEIYFIEKTPVKTKTAFGWQNDGNIKVLASRTSDSIYFLSTLTRCPQLWEVVSDD